MSDEPRDLPTAVARERRSSPARHPRDDGAATTGRWFMPVQIAAASILGSFLAPAVLLAINYGLARPRAAGYAVAGGLLATAAIIVGGVAGPALPWPVWAAIPFVPTLAIARTLQGRALRRHLDRGGRRASHGAALGVACASMVLLIIGVGCARAALSALVTACGGESPSPP